MLPIQKAYIPAVLPTCGSAGMQANSVSFGVLYSGFLLSKAVMLRRIVRSLYIHKHFLILSSSSEPTSTNPYFYSVSSSFVRCLRANKCFQSCCYMLINLRLPILVFATLIPAVRLLSAPCSRDGGRLYEPVLSLPHNATTLSGLLAGLATFNH